MAIGCKLQLELFQRRPDRFQHLHKLHIRHIRVFQSQSLELAAGLGNELLDDGVEGFRVHVRGDNVVVVCLGEGKALEGGEAQMLEAPPDGRAVVESEMLEG